MKTEGGRFSRGFKAALLETMVKTPAVEPAPRAGSTSAGSAASAGKFDTSFETLPAYQAFRTQRAVADALHLNFPFYRVHDAMAGARSVIAGQPVVNFASYDYLGLNGHPDITAAVIEATKTWGTSVSASRITAGERDFHRQLERALADIYEADDALVFVSGHATAISTVAALLGPKDLILHDSLIHNCVVVGAQLSGATRRPFPHNDLAGLEAMLAATRDKFERVMIITEGLFSMDGDGPDLARLVEIKDRFDCWLMVDEAHSVGVLGATGRGIAEQAGIDPRRVDIWLGTLSKTLVSCGGYVAGSRPLIDFLKLAAPGMVYSVGMPAPAALAALTAIEIMRREPARVARLQANGQLFLRLAREAGLDVGTSAGYAVTPVIIGDSLRTVLLAERLLKRGINAFPIVPPGVPEKSARLRFFISSEHTEAEIRAAVAATAEEVAGVEREGISLGTIAKLMIKRAT
ncbi:MAG: 8-amino-7-oxononanoate synthase [Acidiphilium sp. 37-64-53]|uniref:aminotransferase class I/II-fold pyridoxal phosphate-dependent enzyme n=1 Tax=Acidiphilium TaxID=522 RepID=UPI000BD6FAF8|nr:MULTISPECIES: aminotransferase class I/II-fold pyridoxal phosphate-dependent enzyme [Acidiphilium]OYW02026.1 MAG: 8-amino-7-oxononanoate synthase [Acidiphilium sp. 37-64-53]OZB26708.1 MAG: 8-amino-7-oxononanoate synthase [Acidiphilium sp. 34-64-41]HQT85375.1 aminotransferase class I/II-fold pyridoxal phosphate-dependent enzyme [Acidiphilium rubrum]